MSNSSLAAFAVFAALAAAGCRSTPQPGASSPLQPFHFQDEAAESGLNFRHFTGATGEFYLPEMSGSGLAVFDFDKDGDLDVFFVQSRMLDPRKPPSAAIFPPDPDAPPGSRLFRNNLIPSGSLSFSDVTSQAGISVNSYGMGVAVGDFDGDSWPDLFITAFDGNTLLRNNRQGGFTDVTAAAGVRDGAWSTGAAFFDYDRDGDQDLFVARYIVFSIQSNRVCYNAVGERDHCGPIVYPPMASLLFRNDGNGRFSDVSRPSGIAGATGNGFTVSAVDLNADGYLDIVVANDTTPNHLWINKKDGTFEESGLMSGIAYNGDGETFAGMGIAVGDPDGDGDEDLFVTNLTNQHNTLYRNLGNGLFQDASALFDLDAPSRPYTAWGTAFADFDNDSHLDLFAANGAVISIPELRGQKYPYHQRNQIFRNSGAGKFFDLSANAGPGLQLSEGSRGAAFGDIDNDGDIDIVLSNNDGPARLLLNKSPNPGRWLALQLVDAGGKDAAGARVSLLLPDGRKLWRRAARDGSFLSASDIRLHFGLGAASSVSQLTVFWPSGRSEHFDVPGINRYLRLQERAGRTVPSPSNLPLR